MTCLQQQWQSQDQKGNILLSGPGAPTHLVVLCLAWQPHPPLDKGGPQETQDEKATLKGQCPHDQ